ncbi:interleukin-2 receptor subunit beta [Mus pahari]|uniref:interleukin-2 receptor subunit beta n=1 Tax=Mus pahari TaxID=10093 RepID=UPI000A304190|nr:interleukin-2 receptor subunit beta [Mus pahari]XP_021072767.1 interleukin-2 receptor subunit beta [Mus pahari]
MAAIALSWRLALYIFLLLLATPWASAAVKDCSHLECFYNSRANVSCMWSHEEALNVTSCHIHAKSDLRHWNKTCELTLVRQTSWACNLILGQLPDSQSLTSVDLLDISVVCWEEKGWRRVKTCNFRPFDNLRLVAPHSLQVLHIETQRCNISWKVSQVSHYIESYLEFEARRRLLGHSWEDASVLSLKQRQQWLFLEMLIPSTSYEVQVRVIAQRGKTRTWSPWSQPLIFRTRPADPTKEILPVSWLRYILLVLGCFAGFVSCVYILVKCRYLGPWLKTVLKCDIPDPSAFFSQLSSQHGGDLQKWLSSPVPSSFFSPSGPAPEISPLEVLDRDSKAMQLLLLQKDPAPSPSPSGHSQASCFTNQGYFFFHLPNALEIESCQVYFTYDPCVEEDVEEDGPRLPEGSPHPPLLPLAGEQDDYCAFPPRDDLLLFSLSLSTPNTAYGGSIAPEERPLLSLHEGLPSLTSPDLMGLQRPLGQMLGGDGEGLSADSSEEQASVPEGSLQGQDQDRGQGPVLTLNTDAYLSLQELQAQDSVHLI